MDRVFFDVILRPHRSLGPKGFVALMAALACVSFVSGVVFVSIGAWPVFGFFGLDVGLVYLAFRASYRQAQGYETLTLTEKVLTIRRVSPRGLEQRFHLEPYWLYIEIDELPDQGAPLILRSQGQNLSVGNFLSGEQRLALARDLRDALQMRSAALIARPE